MPDKPSRKVDFIIFGGLTLRMSFITAASLWAVSFSLGPALAQTDDTLVARSAEFSAAYLRTWSTDTRASLLDVPHIYAARVNFYGRLLNHAALIREKAQFARRWPQRQYSLRPGTLDVQCDERGPRCVVRAVIDWRAESPARMASTRGTSTFLQALDLAAERPLVIRETGAVVQSRPAALTRRS
jgi:hypothetical protein